MTSMGNLRLILASMCRYGELVALGRLRLRRDRLRSAYRIEGHGLYEIFRETVSSEANVEPDAVLVVGFRLRAIGSHPLPHWLFQRLCILTTPFWSGFRGFGVKLWMVDPETKNYLGIYRWAGADNAQTYVELLGKILRPLSTPGSVWHELHSGQEFEAFLRERRVDHVQGETRTASAQRAA
jgi:hypothetical protein